MSDVLSSLASLLGGPPSSQKASVCPISFLLSDDAGLGPPVGITLWIRPEDLTRSDPSRLTVQQTLGGAWGDSFGPGVPTISLAGTTGWRQAPDGSGDGQARFLELRATVFDAWHARRLQAVQSGLDPNVVTLIFADALNSYVVVVAPQMFTLRRSKARPLLSQYQITLVVLDQVVGGSASPADAIALAGMGTILGTLADGLAALTLAIDVIQGAVGTVLAAVADVVGIVIAPIAFFMSATASLFGQIYGLVQAGSAVIDQVIGVGIQLARAGINLFQTVASLAAGVPFVEAEMMIIAGSYSTVFCLLNAATSGLITYQSYDDLYGASNCSSTAGGSPVSPLAGTNPFDLIVPTSAFLPVALTPVAQASLAVLAANDPVLAPMPPAQLSATVGTISGGMTVAVAA